MLQFFVKKNGSITVFLSMILVPTLVFMSILVDGAAYTLSKGMVESAGELAANAALADYDTVLKDVYGLFAMSQKADDPAAALEANVSRYFQDSLKANGIIPEGVDWDSETMNWISSILNGAAGINEAAIGSLVDVELQDSSTVTYIEGSDLANPDVLRSQIVEYSKYRAPINAALSAIDSLGAFKKVNGQSTVLDKRTEVEETLSDVNKKMKHFYDCIKQFDEQVTRLEQELVKAKEASFNFNHVEPALKVCHSILVNLELEPLSKYNLGSGLNNGTYSCDFDDMVYVKGDGALCRVEHGSEVGHDVGSWSGGQSLERLSEEFDKEALNADTAKNELNPYTGNVLQYSNFSGMTLDNPVNTATTSNPTKLKEAMKKYKDFSKALEKMKAVIKSVDDAEAPSYDYPDSVYDVGDSEEDDSEESGSGTSSSESREEKIERNKRAYDEKMKAEFEEDKKELKERLEGRLKGYSAVSVNYMAAMAQYQRNFETYDNRLRTYLSQIHDLLHPVAIEAAKISKDIDIHWNWFDTSIGTISQNVKNTGNDVITALQKLQQKLREYEKDIKNYNSVYAEGKSDEFSATMSADEKKLAEQYQVADVQMILDQVDAAVAYVTNKEGPVGVIAAIDSFQLAKVGIEGYWSGDSFTDVALEGMIEHLLEQYNKSSEIKGSWPAAKTGTYHKLDSNTSSLVGVSKFQQSVLHKVCTDNENLFNKYNTTESCYLKKIAERGVKDSRGKAYNVPPFYFYLATCFEELEGAEAAKDSKENMDEFKDQSEDLAQDVNEENTDLGYSSGVFEGVPSQGSSESSGGHSSSGDGIFSFFSKAVDTFTDIFTAVNNLNGENIVDTMLTTEYVLNNFSMYTDTVGASEPRQTYSNLEINEQNNHLYGCEVEYILYGSKGKSATKFLMFSFGSDKGPEINVNEAKANIFAVRLMFDMVFAMTDSAIDYQTLPPAMAIQAATSGIFPYQVAQTVIKLCLALAEANYDVSCIMKNEKVVLVKTKDSWVCQLSGLVNEAKQFIKTEAERQLQGALAEFKEGAIKGIQEAIDAGSEDIEKIVIDSAENVLVTVNAAVNDSVNAAMQIYTDAIEGYYQKMLTQNVDYNLADLKDSCNTAVQEYLANTSLSEEVSDLINDYLLKKMDALLTSGSNIDGQFKALTLEMEKIEVDAGQLAAGYSDLMNNLSAAMEETTSAIVREINKTVDNIADEVSAELKSVINQAYESGKVMITDASAQISECINSKLDQYFPSSTVTTKVELKGEKTSATLGSSFNMGYQEYLRVFLLIRLLSDRSNQVIMRVADVIQINVRNGLNGYQYTHPAKTGFKMSNAYTYLEINADIGVKPLLISQDWFERMQGSKLEYLQYDYNTIAGY